MFTSYSISRLSLFIIFRFFYFVRSCLNLSCADSIKKCHPKCPFPWEMSILGDKMNVDFCFGAPFVSVYFSLLRSGYKWIICVWHVSMSVYAKWSLEVLV